MASPFSIFRKNQKVLMAAVTLLSIVAFVFLTTPMMNSFSGSGAGAMRSSRTSKFGNVTAQPALHVAAEAADVREFSAALGAKLAGKQQSPQRQSRVARCSAACP